MATKLNIAKDIRKIDRLLEAKQKSSIICYNNTTRTIAAVFHDKAIDAFNEAISENKMIESYIKLLEKDSIRIKDYLAMQKRNIDYMLSLIESNII